MPERPFSGDDTVPVPGPPVLRDPVGLRRVPAHRLLLLQHAGRAAVRDAEQEVVFGVVLVLLVKRVAGHRLEATQREIRVRICRGEKVSVQVQNSTFFFFASSLITVFFNNGEKEELGQQGYDFELQVSGEMGRVI